MKTRFALSIVALTPGLFLAAARADDKKDTPPKAAPAGARANLGVKLAPLPPPLAKQMPALEGRGVLIAQVVKGSPAEKAGLKPYDILVRYDQHDLTAPEQLVQLVQADKPGREVSLEAFSGGKAETLKVSLGSSPAATAPGFPAPPPGFHPGGTGSAPQGHRGSMWDLFDSITLTRTDDTHFKADVAYKDDKGNVQRKHFDGTRDEIRSKIEAEKDMPAAEREQLLHALDLKPRGFEFPFP